MPEAMVTIYLGLILIGIRPQKRRVFLAGILQGISYYFISRNFGFGMHILLQYLSFVLLTYVIINIRFSAALISNLIAVTIGKLVEGSIGLVLPFITGLTPAEIMSRDWIRVMCFMPYLGVLVVIALLCWRYNFTLEHEIKGLKKINGKISR